MSAAAAASPRSEEYFGPLHKGCYVLVGKDDIENRIYFMVSIIDLSRRMTVREASPEWHSLSVRTKTLSTTITYTIRADGKDNFILGPYNVTEEIHINSITCDGPTSLWINVLKRRPPTDLYYKH